MSAPTLTDVRETDCALTGNQLNIWLGQESAPALPLYNELTVFVIDGPLDRERFDRALQLVIDGTDALRLVVNRYLGQPHLGIRGQWSYRSAYLSFVDTPNADGALADWAHSYVDSVLDLSVQVFDSTLIELGTNRWAWALLQHHIASDATSMNLIFERVSELYARLAVDPDPSPVDYPAFADYVDWHTAFTAQHSYADIQSFWQQRLVDPPPPMVFTEGRSLHSASSRRRLRRDVVLDRARVEALRALAARNGIRFVSDDLSLFGVFAAALFVLLHRISGERRRTIGVPWQNRTPAAAGTVGLLMEQDPFTVQLADDDTFTDLVRRVHAETLAHLRHLPFAAGNPGGRLYDVTLNVLKVSLGRFAGMPVDAQWYRPSFGEGSLHLQVHDMGVSGELTLSFDFHPELFSQEQRQITIDQFLQILDSSVADADVAIGSINVQTPAELEMLGSWNSTDLPYPSHATVLDLFLEQASTRPDQIAVRCAEQHLTYAELDRRAEAVARMLRQIGIGSGGSVGVCLNRSTDMLAAVLGVMRSGAAYVPLDPAFPAERLAFMLADSGASALIIEPDLRNAVDAGSCAVLDISADPMPSAEVLPSRAETLPRPDDLAYVLYTSGSTGRPKGVRIPHRALTNFLWSMRNSPGCDSEDVVLAVTTLSFDIAGLELYLPLISGAVVEIATRATATDGRRLTNLLDSSGATILQATPATWRMLIEAGWTGTPNLKALVGGEPLPPELVAPLLARTSSLWNMYGPTETTIWSSVELITDPDAVITIGRPIANTTFHVLDADGRPTPVGVPGELYIGGHGLASGYQGRPDLNAARFVADGASAGATRYRTGDLVRFLFDGRLVHLGRLDNQVKIRGHRIELGEIELALISHPEVKEAAVHTQRIRGGADMVLVGYVVTGKCGALPPATELRDHLRRTLPNYMVPTQFVEIDRIPLTPNRKIDRRALPAPESGPGLSNLRPPRTAVERSIAAIWTDLLQLNQVGVQDDFFELGGHSLLALQMLGRICDELLVDLPLHRLFVASTLEEVAAAVEHELTAHEPAHETAAGYEHALATIWSGIFGAAGIGRDENFLALQGDRDLVDEMLERTRDTLGVVAEGLSASEFRQDPTIAALARSISDNEKTSPSLIVPLRMGGRRRPLFLVHAGGGYVFFYRALAAQLASDRPVYGIRAETLREGAGQPYLHADSIETVAARYVEEITSVQPSGPYLVGGACAGGLIAFEMARQLIARGDELAGPIVIFDAILANNAYLGADDLEMLRDSGLYSEPFLAALRRSLTRQVTSARGKSLRDASHDLTVSAARRIRIELRRAAAPLADRKWLTRSPRSQVSINASEYKTAQETRNEVMAESVAASMAMSARYVPRPVDASAIVFSSASGGPFGRSWAGTALRGVSVHESPGEHLDMLEHPLVVDVAARIDECLNRSDEHGQEG